MIRLPARPAAFPLAPAAAAALLLPWLPVTAQDAPPSGSFDLPAPSPTPAPAPAGPADERAGVAIPPRAVPTIAPTAAPTPLPARLPPPVVPPLRQAQPNDWPAPEPRPAPRASAAPTATPPAPRASATAAPAETPGAVNEPWAPPPAAPLPDAVPDAAITEIDGSDNTATLPAWWPLAAGVMAALALLGGGAWLWGRRKPKVLRIAAPAAAPAAPSDDPPRLDLTLDITGATRSLMMFTIRYRLNIANRSERAVTDLSAAMQLVCARASTGARTGTAPNAPSPGSAQALAQIDRVGPHQSRSITGEVQLPLSAIAPLRQGTKPLFVPLVHATIEGQHQRALTKSFVIGTPSASGRVHPIPLDVQAGAINGLVAQAIAVPAPPAAAPAAA